MVIGTCLFILAVGAGLLALSSCSTSPEGIAREDALITTLSNTVDNLKTMAPLTPPPANSFVEPLLGVCSAALAIWSGYLHRNVRILVKAANGSLSPPGPTPPTAADLAARLAATKPPGP
jgi:hypothetical protein